MKKLITFITIIIIVLSGGYIYKKSIRETKKESAGQIAVSLNSVAYKINEGKTALDLLRKYTKVETKGGGANAYVISINGKKALSEKREYWAFYVNGKASQVGAGSYQLKDGDKIEWKIEKY